MEALFIRIRTEDVGVRRLDGGNAESNPLYLEDVPRSWTQWLFKDANGAKRCMVTGLMLPNVCIMNGEHWLDQLELIDQYHSESIQQTRSSRMDGGTRSVSPTHNFNSSLGG